MDTVTVARRAPAQLARGQVELPAAIYCRISRDRTGDGLGVERQEADCRALAERLGWNVVAVFVDNDISAYSGKRRPQYEAMLDKVREGRVRGLLAWDSDRLHRRAVELETFVAVVEQHQVQVQTVTSGKVDLSTPDGRMVARLLGSVAQREVEHGRERIRRQKAQAAQQGKYRGGPRPYGFERDGLTIRHDEAQVIREATEAILGGRSLARVARDLNAAGRQARRQVKKKGTKDEWEPRTVEWTYNRLRDMLIRPRNAGKLSTGPADRGRAVIIGKAQWEPIVDEETWRAVYNLLNDPSRRKQQGTTVRWLGSGIYSCGKCGEPMRCTVIGGSETKRGGTVRHYYRCVASTHLMIRQDKTDEFVLGVVAELVRDDRVRAAMQPGEDDRLSADRQRRAVLVQRLENAESEYAQGVVNGRQLQKVTTQVEAELEEIDARMAVALQQSKASPVLGAADPGQALLDAPLDVQRAVLAAVLQIDVMPSASRGVAWSSERIRLTPVTGA